MLNPKAKVTTSNIITAIAVVVIGLWWVTSSSKKESPAPAPDTALQQQAAAREADRKRNEAAEKEQSQNEAKLIAAINQEIQSIHSKKFSIKLDEVTWKKISGTIIYLNQPSSFKEVQRDTSGLVRTILKTAVASGQNPSKNWMFIAIGAQGTKNGETGKELYIPYGSSSYNFNNDSIEYRDPRN